MDVAEVKRRVNAHADQVSGTSKAKGNKVPNMELIEAVVAVLPGVIEDMITEHERGKRELVTTSEIKEQERKETIKLRDQMAMAALTALVKMSSGATGNKRECLAGIAEDAYDMADAMLAEREKEGKS